MDAVVKRLKDIRSQVETVTVLADFSNATRAKEAEIMKFYEDIKRKIDHLDIAILINNAGVMYTGPFDETPAGSSRWKEIIDVNVMHVGMMTQLFKDNLIARQ